VPSAAQQQKTLNRKSISSPLLISFALNTAAVREINRQGTLKMHAFSPNKHRISNDQANDQSGF
jgi:hypothetical protein